MFWKITLIASAFFCASNAATVTLVCGEVTCTVGEISPITSENDLLQVEGLSPNFVDSRTEYIFFEGSRWAINYVPKNLFTIFPVLLEFILKDVELKALSPNIIYNCDRLVLINLQNNKITAIPSSFASSCEKLQTLNLRSNVITSIDMNALSGLKNLGYLDISSNFLICIPPKLFQATPNIIQINLQNNQISAIGIESFANLVNLQEVNLSNNLINYIPALHFANTQSTLNLRLNFNTIEAIDPNFLPAYFKTSQNLNIYYQTNNYLKTCIPFDVIRGVNYPTISFQTWNSIPLSSCYGRWTENMNFIPKICLKESEVIPTTIPLTTTETSQIETTFSAEKDTTQKETTEIPITSTHSEFRASTTLPPQTTTESGDFERTTRVWKFGDDKEFMVIVTNVVKNFTATVTFY